MSKTYSSFSLGKKKNRSKKKKFDDDDGFMFNEPKKQKRNKRPQKDFWFEMERNLTTY